MSSITIANEYTPIKSACFGWVKPKPKKTLVRKELIKRNEKAAWAKEGLNIKETVAAGDLLGAMYEQTEKDLARQRFPDQEDFKKAERRMGKRMLHTEFIKRVLSLNKSLIYQDSKGAKGSGAFYLVQNGVLIYTGACFRKGWLPEWTIIKTDAADLPTAEGLTYGWRTVLQRLLQKKAITYRQVETVFGAVRRNDLCGKNWRLNTQNFWN
jgi:hypothetical protein